MGQDSIEPIMTFEAPAGGTSCIVWIDSVSGDFQRDIVLENHVKDPDRCS